MHKHTIKTSLSGRDALLALDLQEDKFHKTLIVVDDKNIVRGSITDGDVRRGLINGLNIDDKCELFTNKNFKYELEGESFNDLIEKYKAEGVYVLPIVNELFELIEIYDLKNNKGKIPVSVMLMAGGFGSRLKPLTNDTPKPMLKIGDKPMIENLIDQLIKYGIEDFHISVRYMKNQIKEYFGNGLDKGINISYVEENEPLGTCGSLKLMKNIKNENIILINSDILTDLNFNKFFEEFKNSNADMSVVGVGHNIEVPYAVIESENDIVKSFKEKPKFIYQSNAGIYLLKKEILELIPNKKFDSTDLMELIINRGQKLTIFKHLGYWNDVGRIEDFIKAQVDIKSLNI
jgi:dTDP-glucose pyrophosphorylase